MSNMDLGYPGISPFASFNNMYLFSSGSIEIIVGLPSICDLKTLPYLHIDHNLKLNNNNLFHICYILIKKKEILLNKQTLIDQIQTNKI